MSYKGSEWKEKNEWKRYSVKVEKSLADKFEKKCKKQKISFNRLLNDKISEYVEKG